MPPKRKKQEHDFAVIAHRVFEQATGEVQPAKQGARRRLQKLTEIIPGSIP